MSKSNSRQCHGADATRAKVKSEIETVAHLVDDNRLDSILDVLLKILDARLIVEGLVQGHVIFTLDLEAILCDADPIRAVPA